MQVTISLGREHILAAILPYIRKLHGVSMKDPRISFVLEDEVLILSGEQTRYIPTKPRKSATTTQRDEILKRHAQGEAMADIALALNIKYSTVRYLVKTYGEQR
jgi:DNA-binding NarL/FixJ family response regulator